MEEEGKEEQWGMWRNAGGPWRIVTLVSSLCSFNLPFLFIDIFQNDWKLLIWAS